LTSIGVPGGNSSTLAYDVVSQLSTLTTTDPTATIVQRLTFGYDARGNRTSTTDLSAVVTPYAYDQGPLR
jgi:YD repeat-containing protein